MIIGITRVRNESLIIEDTIKHFLKWCDHILLYDDASNDNTADLAGKVGGDRITVFRGSHWRSNRLAEETRHRKLLADYALKTYGRHTWCLCFDADERLTGCLPDLNQGPLGFRFRLFDGYMSRERNEPYRSGRLTDLPRMWGPEYRDILMLFRADKAQYEGLDRREPIIKSNVSPCEIRVKHYGKCLSIDHWEDTCNYYSRYFPARYKRKWEARKGKAIHIRSDFNHPLFTWHDLMQIPSSWIKL